MALPKMEGILLPEKTDKFRRLLIVSEEFVKTFAFNIVEYFEV